MRAAARPADLVLRGGQIYTMDAARTGATTVAVRNGLIVYVGGDSLPKGLTGSGTEIVELEGAMESSGTGPSHHDRTLHHQRRMGITAGQGTGSIEVGKLADLVVLDRNLFEISADRIHQTRVVMTLLECKRVYVH